MRKIKRIISSILTAAMLLPSVSSVVSAETSASKQSAASIRNDYLEFSVNKDTGFFAISTLDGHPQKAADNNMNLLYDGDSIETSFTTVRIDDKDYIFGQDYGIFGLSSSLEGPTVDAVNNTISMTWTIYGISITQKAQISRTDNTSSTGNVHLSYQIDNKSEEEHDIGIRVMLDNALGEIDAPVTLVQSELAPISKEVEFFTKSADGSVRDPGTYVRYLDSYEAPTREAYITFGGLENPEPDRLIVGHWYHLASSKWECTPDTDLSFDTGFNTYGTADTATALYWKEKTYAVNESFTPSVTYGVGDFTADVVNAKFNISLDLEGELVVGEDGQYTKDLYKATLRIYNNVDGSVDIENAMLHLSCDDGLTYLLPAEDGSYVELSDYTAQLGYIAAGTVETYTYQIRVEEQTELKPLEVKAVVRGNTEDDIVRLSKYILAPGSEAKKYPFAIQLIEDNTFHKTGQRVMTVSGTFPTELMEDKTKWAAAFVSCSDSSLRYEIDTDQISFADNTKMSLSYTGDMVPGEYMLEFAFYEELEQGIANFYIAPSRIFIVDDPSLMVTKYSYIAIYRTGASTVSQYTMQSLNSEEELKALEEQMKQANLAAGGDNAAEILLILQGSFAPMCENGHTIGYTALDSFTVNECVTGLKDSTITYLNYTVGEDNTADYDGVIIRGKGEARTKDHPIFDCDWKIEVLNNYFHSLTDDSIRIESEGAAGYFMDIIGGLVNLKYGTFGKGEYDTEGYYISFGGTFTFAGYQSDKEGNYITTPPPTVTENGFDPTRHSTPEVLKVNKKTLYASAAIEDVIFTKNGFHGINTTVEIGVAAANLLQVTRKEGFSLMLHIDTINRELLGDLVITVKGYQINAGIEFVHAETKNGTHYGLISSIYGTVVIPPTSPLPIVPPYVGLTQAGFGLYDFADIQDVVNMETPEEAVAAVSSLTTQISVNAGLLICQVLQGIGMIDVTAHSIGFTIMVNTPYLPGLNAMVSYKLNARWPIIGEDGEFISPVKFTVSYANQLNVFSIIIAGTAVNVSVTGEQDEDVSFMFPELSAALQLYGGIYVPALVPVVGGLELLGATGVLSTVGVSLVANIIGIELGVSYGWGDEEPVYTYAAGTGEDEQVGFSNMRVLSVEAVEREESASAYSLRRAASGSSYTESITSVEGLNTLIAVHYTGERPSADDLSFMIDGEDFVLVEADKADYYRSGNCIILDDKIIIAVRNPPVGKKEYTISTTSSSLTFDRMEAIGLSSSASAESVTVNDDTITVRADSSLKGSTVQLYYAAHPEMYEDIRTEPYTYTDENGEEQTGMRVYTVIDGEETELDESGIAKISEHQVYTAVVEEDSDTITIDKADLTVDENIASGEYYVMAAVISENKKVTHTTDRNHRVTHVNDTEPKVQIAGAELRDIGDETLELVITDGAAPDYNGYYISIYDEISGEYIVESEGYAVGETMTFHGEAGSSYHAEIETVRAINETSMAISSVVCTTKSVTLHEPEPVDITFGMTNAVTSGTYRKSDGEIITVDYIDGKIASFTAVTGEAVRGAFIVDGMETVMNAADQRTSNFFYSGEFDEGVHTVGFRAVNARGDSTTSDYVTFAVNSSEPSVQVESAVLPVENGKVTLKGIAYNTETITFMGKNYTPAADGTFEITENVILNRFAQRYIVTASGRSGLTSTASVLAVDMNFRPISSVDILVDGRSADRIEAQIGDTFTLDAVGYADGITRDVSDTAVLSVVEGSNVAVLDGNTLKVTADGTAFVKLTYDMGTYINDSRTEDYYFEDILEITAAGKSSNVTASIPNGAVVLPGTLLTLSGAGTIYYTTDGSEPTMESTLYTGPIVLDKSVTIKAVCYENGKTAGDVVTFTFIVERAEDNDEDDKETYYPGLGGSTRPGAPGSSSGTSAGSSVSDRVITASIPSGKVDMGYPVELKTDGKGTIYYTTDGTTPNRNSAKYDGPIIITGDTVIKAVVWNGGGHYSEVYTFRYTVRAYSVRPNGDLEKSGLMNGYPDGTFRPDAKITRAETAALLRRAAEISGYYVCDDVFSDVDMWAEDAINELAAAGVVTGYPDGIFRPNSTVTRAEFVTMLMRLIGQEGGNAPFDDVRGHWAEKYIAKAAEYGYIGGYPDGTFRPDANITRAEAFRIMVAVFGFETDGTNSRFADVKKTHWLFPYIAD